MRRPARISSIEVHGALHTRRHILDGILNPLVQDGSSTTLSDVLYRLAVAHRKLDRLGASCRLPHLAQPYRLPDIYRIAALTGSRFLISHL